MQSVRFIKDGVFLEDEKRYDTDDIEEVSDEVAKLLYTRNWAVPNLNDFSIVNDEPVVASESDNKESVALNPDVYAAEVAETEVVPKGFKRK